MAAPVNQFANDGSFFEQFKRQQEEEAAKKEKDVAKDPPKPTKALNRPVIGRLGGHKKKSLTKQSVITVHKSFQEDSDEESQTSVDTLSVKTSGPSTSTIKGQIISFYVGLDC